MSFLFFSKKRDRKQEKTYNERAMETVYKTVRDTLADVLKTEVSKKNDKGEEVPDLSMTISAIRTKARITLDFVEGLENKFLGKK
jgi:hypothetical protein